jgi:putative NIF3 family GTP cyclohydrolase 1 type 2
VSQFGDYKGVPLGVKGHFKKAIKAKELQEKLHGILNHNVLLSSPDENEEINTIGIITGGANNEWEECLKDNLDAYLTGEISEYNWHDSQEAGVHFFAGGHHATERFGVQSLMEKYTEEV